ncbi:MAG: response regulator [Desulfarculaceae bacterium]|nr:response regulator [Desulfarculaceae bacterium]
MNLVYKVLWVDDQPVSIRGSVEEIGEHIDKLGYEPNITVLTPMAERELDDAIENKLWNLIVVDYNLTKEMSGKDFITKIREKGIIASVVFYSADPAMVEQEIKKSALEGVYWASRDDELEETLKNVIEYTLRIVMNVNSMRGLVMAEVAEMDYDMEDIIRAHHKNLDNGGKQKIELDIYRRIEKSNNDRSSQIKRIAEELSLEKCLDWRVIDSDKRRRTTQKILGQCKIDGDEFSVFSNCQGVLGKRNFLAHGRTMVENGLEFVKFGEQKFNLQEALDLRNELRKQRANFKELKALIESYHKADKGQ